MQGRDYLGVAQDLVGNASEAHLRAAVGRAYYALMLEAREALFRWGFLIPPRDNAHTFVRLRFSFPQHPELRSIGDLLDRLGRLRNKADYDLTMWKTFQDPVAIQSAITDVGTALALLDAIDTDPARQTAAVAAIRTAFP